MIFELLISLILGFCKFLIFPILRVGGDTFAGVYNMTAGSIVGVSQFVNAGFGILAFIVGSATILAVLISLNVSLSILEVGSSITWWVLGKIPVINIQKR